MFRLTEMKFSWSDYSSSLQSKIKASLYQPLEIFREVPSLLIILHKIGYKWTEDEKLKSVMVNSIVKFLKGSVHISSFCYFIYALGLRGPYDSLQNPLDDSLTFRTLDPRLRKAIIKKLDRSLPELHGTLGLHQLLQGYTFKNYPTYYIHFICVFFIVSSRLNWNGMIYQSVYKILSLR